MIAEPDIIVVEDSDVDFDILSSVLLNACAGCTIERIASAEECLKSLDVRIQHNSLPHLLICDLNLIGMSGIELVRAMRNETSLRNVPAIILSTSSSATDVEDAYGVGANSYLTKPIDFGEFEQMVKTLVQYWFVFAQLPNPHRQPRGLRA